MNFLKEMYVSGVNIQSMTQHQQTHAQSLEQQIHTKNIHWHITAISGQGSWSHLNDQRCYKENIKDNIGENIH